MGEILVFENGKLSATGQLTSSTSTISIPVSVSNKEKSTNDTFENGTVMAEVKIGYQEDPDSKGKFYTLLFANCSCSLHGKHILLWNKELTVVQRGIDSVTGERVEKYAQVTARSGKNPTLTCDFWPTIVGGRDAELSGARFSFRVGYPGGEYKDYTVEVRCQGNSLFFQKDFPKS